MAAQTLYRATLRAIREGVAAGGGRMRIRQPVRSSAVQWLDGEAPQYHFVQETVESILQPCFPCLFSEEDGSLLCDSTLWGGGVPLEMSRAQINAIARSRYSASNADANKALDDGFSALRSLTEQIELAECTSVTRTEGICIEASSAYCGRVAQDSDHVWVFSYRLRIRNESSTPVKLLARQWCIKNKDGSIHAEVPRWGIGVVGQTPLLQPSSCFEYASGSTLNQPGGSIEGALQMERCLDDKSHHVFEARVDPFPLKA
eukprot:scaffold218046_cov41-Tisochrysis_lutea.AAC.1